MSYPEQTPHRYAIDFGSMTETEARKHRDLWSIVENRVKPERMKLPDGHAARRLWWQYGHQAKELYERLSRLTRVLAGSQVATHFAVVFIPVGYVYGHTLNVFADDRDRFFCAIQSRIHETWARFLGSGMKDDLRYTPSDCFETFPFPRGWETNAALEDIGRRYHARRAEIMKARWEGLTKTYNRFHDPQCQDADIEELRALHAEMDRAVLAAYGWTDLDLTTDFHPEHADEPEGKKRLRWSDATRDAVLGRLLALNAERAKEESEEAQKQRKGRREEA